MAEMKLIKIAVALWCALTLGGCIKEDRSDCPRENVFLTFVYTGNTAGEELDCSWFDKAIDRVSLYVYDADGQLLPGCTQRLGKAALRAADPAGTRLLLPEGRYTIVCWGNAFDATRIEPAAAFRDGGQVAHPAYGTLAELPTQDHNYFGTTTVDVPPKGEVSGQVRFRGAHIDMEVVVKGFTDERTVTDYPRIEIAHAMPRYAMTTMAEAAPYGQTYVPPVGWSAAEGGHLSSFQLFRFQDGNPLRLSVKNRSQDRTFYEIGLAEAMADGGITVEGLNEASVRIVLDFTDYWKDMSVKIQIAGWSKETPKPEL